MSAEKGLFGRLRAKLRGQDDTVRTIPGYDPKRHEPIIRCSICTGEQTAGYRDRESGTFHEVMLIRDQNDLEEFQRLTGTENIRKEY